MTTRKPRVKLLALRTPRRVDGLPGDEHRHDGRLAGAGRQLQREAHQLRVGVVIGIGQMLKKTLSHLSHLRRDLRQPNGRFDGLNLAEERADAAELVVPPVLKQACRLRRDMPVVRVGQAPPFIYLIANRIDDRGGVVLLVFWSKALCLHRRHQRYLLGFPLSGLGDRRDELGAAAGLDYFLSRLTLAIELPVALGAL